MITETNVHIIGMSIVLLYALANALGLFNRKSPFDEIEEDNLRSKELFTIVDEIDDPMEKLVSGMKHIYGEHWFGVDEIPQTWEQQRLTSTLLTVVLYHSLSETVIEGDE